MSDENIILKFIILGEGRSGKDLFLKKYFKEKNTINPTFYQKEVNYKGKNVILKFWDTAGQDNPIPTMYYQGAVGALIIYDVSIFETFERVKSWVKVLHEAVGKDIVIVIVGNKFDLLEKSTMNKISPEIDSYCTKEHCKHFYTSSNTGLNIEEAFDSLINCVLYKEITLKGDVVVKKGRGKKLEIKDTRERNNKRSCY